MHGSVYSFLFGVEKQISKMVSNSQPLFYMYLLPVIQLNTNLVLLWGIFAVVIKVPNKLTLREEDYPGRPDLITWVLKAESRD
jgi:hypothetical protein